MSVHSIQKSQDSRPQFIDHMSMRQDNNGFMKLMYKHPYCDLNQMGVERCPVPDIVLGLSIPCDRVAQYSLDDTVEIQYHPESDHLMVDILFL